MARSAVIDFHSHILPAVDHGSTGITQTLGQLEIMNDSLVNTVVATPHFYPNSARVEAFLSTVEEAAEKISLHAKRKPNICLGAEVLYCNRLDEMQGLEKLCIRGTDVLLLELPMDSWDRELFDTVDALLKKFTVVLAHIDRYIRSQQDEIEMLLEMGALAQINAYSLFSFGLKRKLLPFTATDSLVALGSDLHGEDRRAYEKFCAAPKALGDAFDQIMERSAWLLRNAEYLK